MVLVIQPQLKMLGVWRSTMTESTLTPEDMSRNYLKSILNDQSRLHKWINDAQESDMFNGKPMRSHEEIINKLKKDAGILPSISEMLTEQYTHVYRMAHPDYPEDTSRSGGFISAGFGTDMEKKTMKSFANRRGHPVHVYKNGEYQETIHPRKPYSED